MTDKGAIYTISHHCVATADRHGRTVPVGRHVERWLLLTDSKQMHVSESSRTTS